ncbi:AAA family ATPase [Burkholderia stabilis]|nr:ATP-binding protein [Burkholderia stabilis]
MPLEVFWRVVDDVCRDGELSRFDTRTALLRIAAQSCCCNRTEAGQPAIGFPRRRISSRKILTPNKSTTTLGEIKLTAAIHIVFGPQGAGKSSYARTLATEIGGTRFSIDEWMAQLYGPDFPNPINLTWIVERVQRCERQIWHTAEQIAKNGGSVVLDLGFMKERNRSAFAEQARNAGLPSRLHYVNAPRDIRRSRVMARNAEKGETFSFEVTPAMFDFMEAEFEGATSLELASATVFNSDVPVA